MANGSGGFCLTMLRAGLARAISLGIFLGLGAAEDSAIAQDRAAPAAAEAPGGTRQPSVRVTEPGLSAVSPAQRTVGPFQYREPQNWNERRFFHVRTEYDPSQPVQTYYPNDQQRNRAAEMESRDPATLVVKYANWMSTGRLSYALQGLNGVLAMLRSPQAPGRVLLPLVHQLLGEGSLMLGDLPQAQVHFGNAEVLLQTAAVEVGEGRAQLADVQLRLGEIDLARNRMQDGIARLSGVVAANRAPALACLDGRLDASYALSLALEEQGRWEDAARLWADDLAARAGSACRAEDLARLEQASFSARKGDIAGAAQAARALLQRPLRWSTRPAAYWTVTTSMGASFNLAPPVFPQVREAMTTTLLQRIVMTDEWRYRPPSERVRIGICGVYEETPQFDADTLALNGWWRSCVDLQLSILLEGTPDGTALAHAYRELQSVRARYVLGRGKLAYDAFTSGTQPPPSKFLLDLAGIAEARSTVVTSASLAGTELRTEDRQLLQRYDDLESTVLKLLQKAVSFELARNDPPLTASVVAGKLPEVTALIEIFKWNRFDRRDLRAPSARYGCFVLSKDGTLRFVDLGPAPAIDLPARQLGALISQYAADTASDNTAAVREVLTELSRRLWDPIKPLTAGAARLLVIPDGTLAMVPFAALPTAPDRDLIQDLRLDYLSSARELTVPRERRPRSPPLVLGAPNFDAELPGSRVDTSGRRPRYAPLEAARAEAGFVAFALKLPADRVLLDGAAAKRALQAAQGPRILHLATHGDFLNTPPRDDGGHPRYPTFWRLEDQFLRAVLVFAGANRVPDQSANGVMTALEVSNLSLFGTQLAVISACTRDRARVELDGQSTSAMRLAFYMAGAQAVISTQWPIPDRQSAELMANFYLGVARKESFGDALRKSQLRMRDQKPHPFYWAAYTFSGKDGTID